eukprot:6191322-Pleurochrysis_carterae.AAC.1
MPAHTCARRQRVSVQTGHALTHFTHARMARCPRRLSLDVGIGGMDMLMGTIRHFVMERDMERANLGTD